MAENASCVDAQPPAISHRCRSFGPWRSAPPTHASRMHVQAGVVGLTKSVAKEWGPFNIRCNALTFGYIATR